MEKRNYSKPKLNVVEIILDDVCLASSDNGYDNDINVWDTL